MVIKLYTVFSTVAILVKIYFPLGVKKKCVSGVVLCVLIFFLNHPVHMLRMEECHTLAQRTSGKNTDKFTT